MTADIISIPVRHHGQTLGVKKLSDIRRVPFKHQPAAVTQPSDAWTLNAYDMLRVIIIRDGEQRTIGQFATVRDAAIAVQARGVLEIVRKARDDWMASYPDAPDDAEFCKTIFKALEDYGL